MNRQLKLIGSTVLLSLMANAMPLFAASVSLTTPLTSDHSSTAETSLGDLTADAILAAAPTAQIALMPAQELLARSFPSGTVDSNDLTSYLKSGSDESDSVVYMNLTGAEIIDALNHGASRVPSPFDGFLQVAGIKATFHHAADGSSLVQSVVVLSTGSVLNTSAHYFVAMPKNLANGEFGYFTVFGEDVTMKDTGVSLKDAVLHFALLHQPLSYQAGSRITME